MNRELSDVYSLSNVGGIGDNLIDLGDCVGAEQWLEDYGLQDFPDDYNISQFGGGGGSSAGRPPARKIAQTLLLADMPAVLQDHEEKLSSALETIFALKKKVEAQENTIQVLSREVTKSPGGSNLDLTAKMEELSQDISKFRGDISAFNERIENIESDLQLTAQFCRETSPYLDQIKKDITRVNNLLNLRSNRSREIANGQQMRSSMEQNLQGSR
ncbi:hypothetical protein TWF481_010411 [Arthrobotrys musiformis]|uniref:Uncharacterized protein n=1 Tax=Arthrobotrys musiformis TaxID=47236 RepID=A0AAV9W0P1_9PEZI